VNNEESAVEFFSFLTVNDNEVVELKGMKTGRLGKTFELFTSAKAGRSFVKFVYQRKLSNEKKLLYM
jgi:hypothetical protein